MMHPKLMCSTHFHYVLFLSKMTSNFDKQKFTFHCQYNINSKSFEGKEYCTTTVQKSESQHKAFYSCY